MEVCPVRLDRTGRRPIVFSFVGTVKNKLAEMRRGKKGFTLVELLVVISIIGVLATLVLLQLGQARSRSRDTKRIADMNQLRSAVELYFEDNNGSYPAVVFGSGAEDLSDYIVRTPCDPLRACVDDSLQGYGYAVSTTRRSFMIWAYLENSAAGALNGDADIDGSAAGTVITSGVNGAGAGADNELCDAVDNCIYDLGTLFD